MRTRPARLCPLWGMGALWEASVSLSSGRAVLDHLRGPRPAGSGAATSGSATEAASQQPQPGFPARRQARGQQRGGRGQGWRLRHPERSAGRGLDRWKPAPLLDFHSAWPGWGVCRLGAPGGRRVRWRPKGAAEDAQQPEPPDGDGAGRAGASLPPMGARRSARKPPRLEREAGALPHAQRSPAGGVGGPPPTLRSNGLAAPQRRSGSPARHRRPRQPAAPHRAALTRSR